MSIDAEVRLRPALESDVPLLLQLIAELAEYEGLGDEVFATPERLRRYLFADRPAAEAVLAEVADQGVGFTLFFATFSSFRARPGIWVEDLFVRPEHRGDGIGVALLTHVARLAVERGCERVEWTALDRNKPALDFYSALGAQPMTEWTTQRLEGGALRRLTE